jgi:biopolymer transport protein TolR
MGGASMSRNPQPANGSIRSEINVTPLVDVCLVLLVIFMVVTPILQAGVKVDLPKTTEPRQLPEQSQIRVSIAEDGTVYIRDSPVADSVLAATLATLHEADPDREVIVRGDRHLKYEKVSEVLTLISAAGFERVGLVTEKRAPEGA